MRTATAALAISLLSISIASAPLRSQTTGQKPSFEVASIKPNNSGSASSHTSCCTGGYFKVENDSLRRLILFAYTLYDFQLVGAPDWINSARYDIDARADLEANPKPSGNGLMQSLLEERFQLKVHRETRELPVFELVLTKAGSKLEPSEDGRPGPNGLRPGSTRSNGGPEGIEISGNGITVNQLVKLLVSRVERPIIDKTNLTGKYDFTLKFAPLSLNTAATSAPAGPDVFTAIQEQLGLKLEAGKGPVEVLVIDSVQKPTVN